MPVIFGAAARHWPGINSHGRRWPGRRWPNGPFLGRDALDAIVSLFANVSGRYLHVPLRELSDEVQMTDYLYFEKYDRPHPDPNKPSYEDENALARLECIYRVLRMKIKDIAEFLESKTGWFLALEHLSHELDLNPNPSTVLDILEGAAPHEGAPRDCRCETLDALILSRNSMEYFDTPRLGNVLLRCTRLRRLLLIGCQVDERECSFLAELLAMPGSNLVELDLSANNIFDDDLSLLINALKGNRTLKVMDLSYNSKITAVGWLELLDLVLGSNSIEDVFGSNDILSTVGDHYYGLDLDHVNLLEMTLKVNRCLGGRNEKSLLKILWRHARGDINIGESNIDGRVLHKVLHHFCNEAQANKILIRAPAGGILDIETLNYGMVVPAVAGVDAVRLDSVYRILHSKVVDVVGFLGSKKTSTQMMQMGGGSNKRKRDVCG